MALTIGAVVGAFFLPRPRPAKVSLFRQCNTYSHPQVIAFPAGLWLTTAAVFANKTSVKQHLSVLKPFASCLETFCIHLQLNGKVNGMNGDHKAGAPPQQSIQGPELLDFLKKRRSVYPKDFSGEPVSRYKAALEPRTVCVMGSSAGSRLPCLACPCQYRITRRAGSRHGDNWSGTDPRVSHVGAESIALLLTSCSCKGSSAGSVGDFGVQHQDVHAPQSTPGKSCA